ncbi:MAG: MarR family transcriptional regulator, partial [Paracoccus sp. (in: a-proteobacteria)]
MSFDLDGFLPYQLSVAATKISRRFAALYRAEAGLTIPEWRVLAHLDRSGRVSVRDITARVHLDKSMVSRAATRL